MPAIEHKSIDGMLDLWTNLSEDEYLLWAGYNVKRKEWKIIEVIDPTDYMYGHFTL